MKAKKIVCFGGGSAMPEAVLESLKKRPLGALTTITSMTDDGGSTGQLRRDFGVLPPGDIRRHILALSAAPKWRKELWTWRFGNEEFEGGHRGHSFGNAFMAGLETKVANYGEVLNACRDFMKIPPEYAALPATITPVTLCAELENGQTVEGESEIDVPKQHDPELKIRKVFLKPRGKAYGPALEKIRKADVLIFGPGDLYSSLLPCFLPNGIKGGIASSRARKILICNIMNKRGETMGFAVEDFAREVEKYIGTKLDHVIYNKFAPSQAVCAAACGEESSLLDPVLPAGELDTKKFIAVDIAKKGTALHDAQKTGEAIWKVIA
jgi:uncharacterized cofD-like protein